MVTRCEKIMGVSSSIIGSRVTYATVDITGKRVDVVINTSNPLVDTVDFKRGYTLCILNAEPLFRSDKQFYYRVDDISTVEVRSQIVSRLTYYYGYLRSAASCFIGKALGAQRQPQKAQRCRILP